MSGGMTGAALYAASMTSPTAIGAVPEDSKAKAHHLKDGKGFKSPWDSWIEKSALGVVMAMIRYELGSSPRAEQTCTSSAL